MSVLQSLVTSTMPLEQLPHCCTLRLTTLVSGKSFLQLVIFFKYNKRKVNLS